MNEAARVLFRSPRYALLVCAVLGVGIGASAAVWSTLRAALIDLPPVAAAEQLRVVERTEVRPDGGRATATWLSYPVFEALRDAVGERAQVAGYTAKPQSYIVSAGEGASARWPVEFVSGNYFELLGVDAWRGRALGAADDAAGAVPVIVVTHAAAQALFGTAAAAVGAQVEVDGYAFTVVGVTESGFHGLSGTGAGFVPMSSAPTLTFARRLAGAYSSWHQVVLRPAPSTTSTELDGVLAAAAAHATERFAGEHVAAYEFRPIDLRTARGEPTTARFLWLTFGAAAALLLLACANAMNLALIRGAARAREFALRRAIGAGFARLVGEQLREAAALGACATVVAIGVAAALLSAFEFAAPELTLGAVSLASLRPDLTLVLGAVVFAFIASAFALGAPAVLAARAARRTGELSSRGSTRRAVARRGLVAVEVALAVLLVVGAGLMLRSLSNLQHVEPGYDADGVLSAEIALPRADYRDEGAAAFLGAALERVASLAGVDAAAFAFCAPPRAQCDQIVAEVAGRDGPPEPVVFNHVSGGYFDVLRVPLLAGRVFDARDGADGAPVVLVSATAAQRLFGDAQRAVGGRVQLGVGWPADDAWAEVIGVVGDLQDAGLGTDARALVYTDFRQFSYGLGSLIVRGAAPAALARPVADAIRALDPNVLPWRVRPLADELRATLARERLVSTLLGGFAVIALLLAVSGVFAVLALTVAQRTREFGVRLAVGAQPRSLWRLVLADGLWTVGVGAAAGIAAASVASGVLEALLFDVSAADPATYALAVGALLAAGIAGALVPARRAARVSPIEALRHE